MPSAARAARTACKDEAFAPPTMATLLAMSHGCSPPIGACASVPAMYTSTCTEPSGIV